MPTQIAQERNLKLIDVCDRVLSEHPDNHLCYLVRAMCHLNLNQPDAALEDTSVYVHNHPDDFQGWVVLAETHFRLKDLDKGRLYAIKASYMTEEFDLKMDWLNSENDHLNMEELLSHMAGHRKLIFANNMELLGLLN